VDNSLHFPDSFERHDSNCQTVNKTPTLLAYVFLIPQLSLASASLNINFVAKVSTLILVPALFSIPAADETRAAFLSLARFVIGCAFLRGPGNHSL
jgi:hypothetical protein